MGTEVGDSVSKRDMIGVSGLTCYRNDTENRRRVIPPVYRVYVSC